MSVSHLSAITQSELQIRALLNEIAQLSKSDIPPDEFHAEFLRRVVAALGAVGGALWILEGSSLALAYQINFKELRLPEGDAKHARLLHQLLHSPDTGTLLPPHSGTEGGGGVGEGNAGNPTDYLLICCPIRTELEAVGVVEIIHRPDAPVAAQASFVQFLAQSCRFATDYYKNRQLRHFGERQHLWTVLEDFTRTIHKSLDPKWTAYTVANEGRRLIGCDRVSVALRRGGGCPITAVSGQDIVNKRATTVRLLGRLATAVLKAGEPIWYTGDTADFPPQIERAIEKYVDESHSKMIAVHPLFTGEKENNEAEQEKKPGKRRKRKRPFGVLIVEQIEDSQVTERTRKRIDIVAEHAGSALGNALEHHSIFLLSLWKLLGKSKKLVSGEMLPKTIAVTTLVVALFAVFFFMPWQFQMHSPGTLEPVLRQRIYSPLDAEIRHLFVDHGTQVAGPAGGYRGTTLLELRSPALEEQEVQLRGELLEIDERFMALDRMLNVAGLSDFDRADLVGQQARARIQHNTVLHRLHIFEQELKPDLFVTSPKDGVVISWDLRRRLGERRPISRMQYVLEIADLGGPWQLELLVPENRMGYITEQLRRNPDAPLRVEFVPATHSTAKHYGTVTAIHARAEVRSDAGGTASGMNTVAITVALDEGVQEALNALDALQPGAAVSARIDCGFRPLGYVLFYEVIAFVQKNVLFRWF